MHHLKADFDVSTAAGQKCLMAVSMGYDSEAFIPRPLKSGKAGASDPQAPTLASVHPLVGQFVAATWKPGHPSLESTTIGQVIDVVPVSGAGSRFRLVILVDAVLQLTQRCYTGDKDWLLAPAAG